MQIIKPSYEIITKIDRIAILKHLEGIGRTCYKSEGKITEISYGPFVDKLVKRGHEAMIEFFDITVKFIHNRGFTHEMVRHRLCNFAQESTRYVNYFKQEHGNEITVIEPYWFDESIRKDDVFIDWETHMGQCEKIYKKMIKRNFSPQAARGVLPIDVKTEIVVKANLREWRHIFQLRCSSGAHPDMRRVMIPLRDELAKEIPEIFGDLVK